MTDAARTIDNTGTGHLAGHFFRKVAMSLITINTCGAVLCAFYFMVLDNPSFYLGMQNYPQVTLSLGLALVAVGLALYLPWSRKLVVCWRELEAGHRPEVGLLTAAQRKAVNAPLTLSLLTFANWVIGSLVLASARYFDYVPIKGDAGQLGESAWVLMGVLASGLLTSCVVFFYMDQLFRPIRRIFFRGGEILHLSRAFQLSVRIRLIVAFLTGSAFPVLALAVMVHRKTYQLIVSNPWAIPGSLLLVQGFVLLIAVVLIWFLIVMIERSVSEPLVAMHRAMGKLRDSAEEEVRVPVSSNDELGYLADSFNKMVQGIEILQVVSMGAAIEGFPQAEEPVREKD